MLINQLLIKTGAYVTFVATGSISRGGGRQEGVTPSWPSSRCGWSHLMSEAPLCLLTTRAQRSLSMDRYVSILAPYSGSAAGGERQDTTIKWVLLCFITEMNILAILVHCIVIVWWPYRERRPWYPNFKCLSNQKMLEAHHNELSVVIFAKDSLSKSKIGFVL